MKPGKKNYKTKQGSTFRTSFTIKYKATDLPWNLTGYVARMQLRTNATSNSVVLGLTSNDYITLGGADGTVNIEILNLQIPAGKYVYDFELESPSGEIYAVIEGRFIVSPNVTR